MKNPYYINSLWLSAIIIVIGGIMLFNCCCCEHYYFNFKSRTETILLGILSSAFLLLFIEIANFIIDKKKYGFLNGKYRKTLITQRNSNGLRSSEIPEMKIKEQTNKVKFIKDSCYHILEYYDCIKVDYYTELKYQYHGIYTGYVEYLDHEKCNLKNNSIIKIKTLITLNLNSANKMTGVGSYKYINKDDFGKYEFQVDEENSNRIIVKYRNTIPSGLAEGYEIWEKI